MKLWVLRLGPEREETNSAPFIHSTGGETEDHSNSDQKALGMMGLVRRDTALLLRDLRLGASSWLNSFLELSGHKSHPKSVPVAGESSLTHPPQEGQPGTPQVLGEDRRHALRHLGKQKLPRVRPSSLP